MRVLHILVGFEDEKMGEYIDIGIEQGELYGANIRNNLLINNKAAKKTSFEDLDF